MKHPRAFDTFALLLLAVGTVGLAACRGPAAAVSNDGTTSAAVGGSPFDTETTDIARVLAGMRPLGGKALSGVIAQPEWRDWEVESRERWGAAWQQRVQPLRAWASTSLTGEAAGC